MFERDIICTFFYKGLSTYIHEPTTFRTKRRATTRKEKKNLRDDRLRLSHATSSDAHSTTPDHEGAASYVTPAMQGMFVFRGFAERKVSQTQITLQEIKTVQKKERLELPAEWARTRWPDSEDMPWISADGQSVAAHDMPVQ